MPEKKDVIIVTKTGFRRICWQDGGPVEVEFLKCKRASCFKSVKRQGDYCSMGCEFADVVDRKEKLSSKSVKKQKSLLRKICW